MNIKIGTRELNFPNEEASVEKIIRAIHDIVGDSEWVVSYLSVDGIDVYEDQDAYLLEHIKSIENIDVGLENREDLIQDILFSTGDYVERAAEAIRPLATEFYQGPSQDTWNQFDRLLEGLMWLLDASTTLVLFWNEFTPIQTGLNQITLELKKALEISDFTLLADLLNYELAPLLEDCLSKTRVIQSKEVN